MSARSSSVTTLTRMPSCFRSSWMIVAIWIRSAFSEFVTIVNSTGCRPRRRARPSGLPREAGLLQQLPRAPRPNARGFGSERFTHSLLPGGTWPQSGVARPR